MRVERAEFEAALQPYDYRRVGWSDCIRCIGVRSQETRVEYAEGSVPGQRIVREIIPGDPDMGYITEQETAYWLHKDLAPIAERN